MGRTPKWTVAALVVALLLSGCSQTGSDGTTSSVSGSPEEQADAAGFSGIKSGELEIWLSVDRLKPHHPEGVKMRLVGTFINSDEGHLPEMDMAIESEGTLEGRNVGWSGGLLMGTDYAVANYEGQTYEPSGSVFEQLRSKLEAAQKKGDKGNALACVEAAEGLSLGSIASHFKVLSTGGELYGTPITAIGAKIDAPAAVDALIQLMEDPTCGAQLKAIGVPSMAWLEAAKPALAREVGEKQGVVLFDRHGWIRELVARVYGKNAHGETVRVQLHARLLRANEPDRSPVTHGYAPFRQLLKKIGVDEATLSQADGGEILTGFVKGIVNRMTGREGG